MRSQTTRASRLALAAALACLAELAGGCVGAGHTRGATAATTTHEVPWELRASCEGLKNDQDELQRYSDNLDKAVRDYEKDIADKADKSQGDGEDARFYKHSLFESYTGTLRVVGGLMMANRAAQDDLYRLARARLHNSEPGKYDMNETAAADKALSDQFHDIVSARSHLDGVEEALILSKAKPDQPAPTGYRWAEHKAAVDAYQSKACATVS
jgi:hypothetical protein